MSIMASKTVKQLITAGNRERNSVRVYFGVHWQHSSANRLMSTKKSQRIVFAPRLY